MPKKQVFSDDWPQQAMRQTQSILERWYAPDAEAPLPYLDSNVSWIGAGEGQYYLGAANVEEALRQAGEALVPCRLSAQNYTATPLGKEFCIVTGRIIVCLENGSQLLTEPQRVTMVWHRVEDALKITHIHVSNNAAVIAPDESFPIKASHAAYRYLQAKLQENSRMCAICASDGVWHNFNLYSVIFLEGDNEYSLIHCKDQTIRVHQHLGPLHKQHFDYCLCVHRSYYVNPLFISVLLPFELTLVNGVRLPVARGRYTKVCDLLADRAISVEDDVLEKPPQSAE